MFPGQETSVNILDLKTTDKWVSKPIKACGKLFRAQVDPHNSKVKRLEVEIEELKSEAFLELNLTEVKKLK